MDKLVTLIGRVQKDLNDDPNMDGDIVLMKMQTIIQALAEYKQISELEVAKDFTALTESLTKRSEK